MTSASTAGMDLLYPVEVADLLRVSRVSIYRLAAKGLLPVYRVCRKMLFKREDVLDYLERSKSDPYGGPED
jgi:excisionase family DNA binding protein